MRSRRERRAGWGGEGAFDLLVIIFGAKQAPKLGGQDRNARCEPVLARRCGAIVRAGSGRAGAGAGAGASAGRRHRAPGQGCDQPRRTRRRLYQHQARLHRRSFAGDPAPGRARPRQRHRQARHAESHQFRGPAAEVPALLAFYRSAANFNGSDEFELEITRRADASRSSTSASMSPQSCGWRRKDLGRGAAMKKYGSAPPPGLRHPAASPLNAASAPARPPRLPRPEASAVRCSRQWPVRRHAPRRRWRASPAGC